MGKLIAVCGSPESGKTTVSLKTAQELYFNKRGSVLYFSPDMSIPSLAFIFPNLKDSDLFSVGKVLDRTDIEQEDVLKQLVSIKTMRNFGFLGYKAGENRYSYPRPTEDKIIALFRVMKEIADYVVVDCVSNVDDLISCMAIAEADSIIRMITPDLKCMAYYLSQSDLFKSTADRSIKVMNIVDRDLYLPIEEVKKHFKGVQFILPYSLPLKQQVISGSLSEYLTDKKYREQIAAIVKRVAS